jgi:hypothetical protein
MLGFFLQFGFSALLYSCGLSFYYLCTIRFGYSEDRVKRHVEPWVHAVSIGYPLTTATVVGAMGAYHELHVGLGCWITDYPPGCETEAKPDTICYASTIGWVVAGIPFLLCLMALVINNILIYRKVREVMVMGGRRSSNASIQSLRIRHVAIQAYLYVTGFFIPVLFTLLLRSLNGMNVILQSDEAKFFHLIFLNHLMFPLQGFCNFVVFMRPRYLRSRALSPDLPWWKVLQATIWSEMRSPNQTTTAASGQHHHNSAEGAMVRLSADGVNELATSADGMSHDRRFADGVHRLFFVADDRVKNTSEQPATTSKEDRIRSTSFGSVS